MSDSTPRGLTAAHLFQAALPAEPNAADDTAETALPLRRALYQTALTRVTERAVLSNAWRDRIRIDSPPAAPATLQDLIAAARDRLRQDRQRDDNDELDRRRFVLRRVLDGLQP